MILNSKFLFQNNKYNNNETKNLINVIYKKKQNKDATVNIDLSNTKSKINSKEFKTHRALTAALGLCAESGEFIEIVKKIVFQGKPVSKENLFHMKKSNLFFLVDFVEIFLSFHLEINMLCEQAYAQLKDLY